MNFFNNDIFKGYFIDLFYLFYFQLRHISAKPFSFLVSFIAVFYGYIKLHYFKYSRDVTKSRFEMQSVQSKLEKLHQEENVLKVIYFLYCGYVFYFEIIHEGPGGLSLSLLSSFKSKFHKMYCF